MKLMPPSAAAQVLHSIETVNGTLVRQLLEAAANRTAAENTIREYDSDRKKVKLPLEFFRLVCKLLPKAGDSEVVVLFFKNYCPLLGEVKGNEAFIPSLTEIIRAFDWSEIGEAVLASMESKDKKGGLSPMEMALYVLDGQDGGVAQEALLKMAVEKAGAMDDSTLFMSDAIGLLWKWVARSEDKSLFDSIAKKLTNAETSLVGSSIQYLSQYLSASEKEKLAVVRPIVVTRVKWLEDEIKALDKKFTWEMPDASVLQPSEVTTGEGTDETTMIDKIQAFLRGSETSMTTKGVKSFKAFQDAQNFAAVYSREGQNHCSFEMEATKADGEVFVKVTKTRDWFLTHQKQLVQFQAELRLLKEKFEGDVEVNAGDKKRARLSE